MPYNPFEKKRILDNEINPYHANTYTLFGIKREKIENAKRKKLAHLNRDISKFKNRVKNRAITEIEIDEQNKIEIKSDDAVNDMMASLNNEENIFNDPEARIREEVKIHPVHRNNENAGKELSARVEILEKEQLNINTLRDEFNVPELKKFIVVPDPPKKMDISYQTKKECRFKIINKETEIKDRLKLNYFR